MTEVHYRTLHEIVKAARHNLNQTYWDYLIGGSETETTVRRNRLAIDSRALCPKVLTDVSRVDATGSLLGQPLSMPVLLAPIGSLQVFDPGGGASSAIAAEETGILSMASSVCTPSIEDIAAASTAPKMYQLYVRGNEAWMDDIVQRVINAGYKGFCLTVDTAVVSRRERDIAKRVSPTSPADPGDFTFQAALNWSAIERLKQRFDIPIILKGISRADDAATAVDVGVEVIYVSNHGGRQLDQGRGALDLLPDIARVVDGKAEIIVDGGFYRGTDILKAIAMGASAVGLGRLQAWALAAGGVPALVRCLEILRHEINTAMALCGVTCLNDLDSSFVCDAVPVCEPDVLSAFPLLNPCDPGY